MIVPAYLAYISMLFLSFPRGFQGTGTVVKDDYLRGYRCTPVAAQSRLKTADLVHAFKTEQPRDHRTVSDERVQIQK